MGKNNCIYRWRTGLFLNRLPKRFLYEWCDDPPWRNVALRIVYIHAAWCGPQTSNICSTWSQSEIQTPRGPPETFWIRTCLVTRFPGDSHWWDHAEVCWHIYFNTAFIILWDSIIKSWSSYWEMYTIHSSPISFSQNVKILYWDYFILPFAKSSWEVAGSPGEECVIFNPE